MLYQKETKKIRYRTAFLLLIPLLLSLILTSCSSPMVWVAFNDDPQARQVALQGETLQEVLQNAAITVGTDDRILLNGLPVEMNSDRSVVSGDTLQINRAYPLTIIDEGQRHTILSSAETVAQALWENQITLSASDVISIPLNTPIQQAIEIEIERSNLVTIQVDGKQINASASAENVGDALAQAGVALQNMDYSIPAENAALPEDGIIQVVRVAEETLLLEEVLPYTIDYVGDPEMDLDTQKVVQAGQVGLSISRVRTRTENGVEVSRTTEESWIAREPVPQQNAYGTKITIQTTSTADGTIEYWRAVTVTAHTYHDTGYKTASGKWPTYGMMAVGSSWWPTMKGTSFYIPGYGRAVVEDKCGACEGNMLIDLFIPLDEYVPWHKTVTLYFLTPVPANIKYILP